MKCLVAYIALVRLLPRVGESVILVVALLVEAFPAELARVRSVALVYPHMRVQRRAAVEGLSARLALVRLIVRVDDLVAAQSRRLAESLSAHFANKRPGAWKGEGKVIRTKTVTDIIAIFF
jgi:hypothetical protein